MPFYQDFVYPHLVDILGDPPPIRKTRRQIIPLAERNVLEIGIGSGANFSHYDPIRVIKLYALEPNLGMVQLAERRARQTKLNIEFIDLPGERIALDDGTVDTVVLRSEATKNLIFIRNFGKQSEILPEPQVQGRCRSFQSLRTTVLAVKGKQ